MITKEIRVLQDFYSYTPNIFTPNVDEINDTFSPSLLNINMNTYNLLIYDRWGKKLFETTAPAEISLCPPKYFVAL